jgi:sigma-B regulation protein RsbU (phosphoserine phosphatase)
MADGWQGIRLSFRSDTRYLEPIRTVVRESLVLVGLEGETADDVVLAVQEGCTNVIRHCYKGCSDERIDLVLSFTDEALEIRIDDYGTFVDPSNIQGRNLDDVRPGGLGVHLMRKVMDSVDYTANAWGGTTLTMVKRRLPADSGEAPCEGNEE